MSLSIKRTCGQIIIYVYEQDIFLIMSLAARLTSLIFQQYRIGLRVELKYTSGAENTKAIQSDGVISAMMLIDATTTPVGR